MRAALIASAGGDAYIVRDMLALHDIHPSLTATERQDLNGVVRASGLGAGMIPARMHHQLMAAVGYAETTMKNELERARPIRETS